ncbi:uncharacterized protein CIMG_13009 [Coccidioides immitis RS]|uniref:Uncharacterized protein n=1 Tax=Coccidioides immitis (strain RS) TaxID=246410 RepID=A0A0D8JW34_COCIM|nr:uncharacterized protein CIMG_13009 [Coccidioides immitis RS]KJF60498.1 hypothetical protein CIMG_13009 [Coccidioides immitis RS]
MGALVMLTGFRAEGGREVDLRNFRRALEDESRLPSGKGHQMPFSSGQQNEASTCQINSYRKIVSFGRSGASLAGRADVVEREGLAFYETGSSSGAMTVRQLSRSTYPLNRWGKAAVVEQDDETGAMARRRGLRGD